MEEVVPIKKGSIWLDSLYNMASGEVEKKLVFSLLGLKMNCWDSLNLRLDLTYECQ